MQDASVTRALFKNPWAGTKWTKSQVSKIGKAVLGPFFRVWFRQGIYILGLQTPRGKVYLGEGGDLLTAFNSVFVDPIKAKERLAEEQAREAAIELEKATKALSAELSVSPDAVVL